MYEGDEIKSGDGGSFDRPGAIVSSSPDEQQNAEPVKAPKLPKAPKPSKVEQPAPMFFQEPTIVVKPVRERTRSKTPLLIGIGAVALLAIVGVVVAVLIIDSNKVTPDDAKVAGRANLAALFDKDAPIPYRTTKVAKYGYVNPNTSDWVIPRVYDAAGPFYGDYALVYQDDSKIIINRQGEEVIKVDKSSKIDYDIDENVWTVNHDVYNGRLQKTNPDKSTAEYLGYGYASVIPSENNDKNSSFSTGIPYITKVENAEKVYDCGRAGCSYILSNGISDDNIYALVHYFLKESKIVSLKDGKELYTAPSNNKLAKATEGVFVEIDSKTNKTVKYIAVDKDEISTSNTKPSVDYDASISKSKKYYVKSCDDGKSGSKIVDDSNNEIVPCGIEKMWELSKNTYERLANDGKEAVIFLRSDGAHLYNLKEGKDIKVYADAYDVEVFENSVFIRLTLKKNRKRMCNIFEPDTECVVIKGNPSVFPTCFTVDDRIYSYSLKVMSNEG